jgi:hypothetical protein
MRIRSAEVTAVTVMALAIVASLAAAGEKTAFATLNDHYEAIRVALLHDHMKDVVENARAIQKGATELQEEFSASGAGVSEDSEAACQALLPEISRTADRLARASGVVAARDAFGELTKPMVRYREMVSGYRPVVVYCPMAKKAWLQPEGEIGNPYYGQSMARCGNVVSK